MRRSILAVVLLAAQLVVASPVREAAAAEGVHSPNLTHLTTLRYSTRWGMTQPFGTDIEFATIRGRDYAFAGTYRNGLQIIDITNPRRPRFAAVYDCGLAQGDVQVFRRGSRVYVAYAGDDYSSDTIPESDCYRDVDVVEKIYGTFLVDVTDPRRPRTAGFVPVVKGSHNQTVHPGGRYLYNSNADFGFETLTPAAIEVFDIANMAKPKLVTELPLVTGIESHDITFSPDGTRAYVAALTHTLVLDTTDPRAPQVIGRIIDPSINIHHQSDPITITDPVAGERTFLIVTDELAGAAGNGACPGGGLHVFDITGPLEAAPVKVGFWAIPDTRPATDNFTCTSHVLRLYPRHKLMTIAWYDAGVRVVDVSGLAGVAAGVTPDPGSAGVGMREIGYHALDDADTWAAKAHRMERDGSFYLFGNDMNRGLDVYRFNAKAPSSREAGTWLTPDQALRALRPAQAAAPVCLLRKAA